MDDPLAHGTGAFHSATLVDGRAVEIRPMTADDRAGIQAFFEALSPEARYWRFFSAQPRISVRLLEQLTASGTDRRTFIVLPAGCAAPVVAFSGYVYVATEQSCEIAFAVADAWQGVGLGTLLALILVRDAVVCGHRHFHAEVLSGNVRMLGLLRDMRIPLRTRIECGVSHVEFEVPALSGR